MKKLLTCVAAAAIAVAALSSPAQAQATPGEVAGQWAKTLGPVELDHMLYAFSRFVLYTQTCHAGETVIAPETWDVMNRLMDYRTKDEQHALGVKAADEMKEEIAARGLSSFCGNFAAAVTPTIRKLNEQIQKDLGRQ